ncbi:uncharacterized protein marchf1 [Paramormyrops kingsleyae]|uniref:uncharacterized protein marchf1 n=1 Tax=Paramormyrops kingsleyae TaxID=1676925 RepID=UPI003B97B00B
MPVHQISVVPAKETASNGRNSGKSKDRNKDENDKVPRRSGSRTSNISKASSSMTGIGPHSVSRTSVTSSSQDICSFGVLPALEEDVLKLHTPDGTPGHKGAPCTGRQAKRRHRRKKQFCRACERPIRPRGVDGASRSCKEPPGHCNICRRESDSSSEEEEEEKRRQERSWIWSRGRARGRSKERSTEGEGAELASAGPKSAGGRGRAPQGGLKKRHGLSASREEQQPQGEASGCGVTYRSPAEEDRICKGYRELDSGTEDQAAPSARRSGGPAQYTDDDAEVCRICHCEGDEDCPLITPCRCTGSLRFVHPDCLHQWIKSSDTRCCELCKYDFIMETQLKPLRKWEKLQMSTRERRQIFCSVSFHIIAVICVVWSLYVLIDRTAEEIKQGRENGVLEWPFWTKLIVVAIGFTGGLIFMYIQCKVYLQLWRRLKAYNRIIFVQNCPDTVKKGEEKMLPASQANGKHDSVEVPVPQTETNSHRPVGGDTVPDVAPV